MLMQIRAHADDVTASQLAAWRELLPELDDLDLSQRRRTPRPGSRTRQLNFVVRAKACAAELPSGDP